MALPDLADYYDRIYHFKDYAAEAEVVLGVLRGLGVMDGSRLLDAACGTGRHLEHLSERYVTSGFDLSPSMLAHARRRAPRATLWVDDLRSFRVDEPVDAAICLFSAIGYLVDRASLEAAAAAFARAVRPGGVVIVEPWVAPEQWKNGVPHLLTGPPDPDCKVARAVVSARDGDISILEMAWLIAERDRGVRLVVETHRLWLCDHALLEGVFDRAGFQTTRVTDGFTPDRGLLIGRRRSNTDGPA